VVKYELVEVFVVKLHGDDAGVDVYKGMLLWKGYKNVLGVWGNIMEKRLCCKGDMFLNKGWVTKIMNITSGKKYHISVDDCINMFRDMYLKKYDSLFEHDIFRFLRDMNKKYGAKFTLHLFFNNDRFYVGGVSKPEDKSYEKFDLTKMPDNFKGEFMNSSEWLKLSFHGYTYNVNYSDCRVDIKKDYEQVIGEIKRFAGEDVISNCLRLHLGLASSHNVENLLKAGIKYILASDNKLSYFLTPEKRDILATGAMVKKDYVTFIKTDGRYEGISSVSDFLAGLNKKCIVLFTHEKELGKLIIQQKIEESLKWLEKEGYEAST